MYASAYCTQQYLYLSLAFFFWQLGALEIPLFNFVFWIEKYFVPSLLMRLSAITLLPTSLVSSLEQCGIRTETDLLFSYTVVDIFQRLPPGTVSMNDLTNYIALVTKWVAAPGVRGDELLHKSTPLSTGVSALDELLGGFGVSRVLEISGDKGTGKTVSMFFSMRQFNIHAFYKSLARHVVLRHLTNHERSGALWIDTAGEFSSEKLLSFLDLYDGQVITILRTLFCFRFTVMVVSEFINGASTITSSFDI
jgi:hypothetical protein